MQVIYEGHGITVNYGAGCQGSSGYELTHDLNDNELARARGAALAEIAANLDSAAPGASRTAGLQEAVTRILVLETCAERNARKARKDYERQAKAEQKVAEYLAQIREWAAQRVEDRISRVAVLWETTLSEEEVEKYAPNCIKAYREARIEADRRNAEWRRRAEEAEREEQERKATEERERAEWIEAHGSVRLKRHVKEEIEHDAIYRDERLAVERPGWQWSSEVAGGYDEPRNVPEETFALLDLARETEPEASIVWWTVEHQCDENCYDREGPCSRYDSAKYAAVAEFLGREIMLFADTSEAEGSDE